MVESNHLTELSRRIEPDARTLYWLSLRFADLIEMFGCPLDPRLNTPPHKTELGPQRS